MSQRRHKKQRRAQLRTRPEQSFQGRSSVADASGAAPTIAGIRIPLVALCLGLGAMVALLYLPVRGYEFTSLDDPQYVTANAVVREGLTGAGVRWAFSFSAPFYWHPLSWLSHMWDVELFGMAAGMHHLTNVVFHAANTVLLFLALRRLTAFTGRSLFVALLFAVHPLHIESVAWIAERKDVLSTFFWMSALYAYPVYARAPSLRRFVPVVLLFAAGLMAKPMVVTLPFVLILLDYWPLKRLRPESGGIAALVPLLREKIVLFALAGASVWITLMSQRGSRAVVSFAALSLFERIGNAAVSYLAYIGDMFWPAGLAVFYPLQPPTILAGSLAVITLGIVTFLTVRTARSQPYLFVGWAWYLGTLLPVIGLTQAGDQGRADRFTYVPLVGLFIAIAWGIAELARRNGRIARLVPATAALVTAILTLLTRVQLKSWQDDLTLWGRAVQVTKGNYRAENSYGVALTDRGRLLEGIQHYEAALKIWPEYPEGHNNLGTARMEQGRPGEAVKEFEAAVRRKPNNATFRYNLAVALDASGRRPDAIRELQTALKSNPGNPQLLNALEVFAGRPP